MKRALLILLMTCGCANGQTNDDDFAIPAYMGTLVCGTNYTACNNITLPTDYAGTIQVGDKVYKMMNETNVIFVRTLEFDAHTTYSDVTIIKTNITSQLKEIK